LTTYLEIYFYPLESLIEAHLQACFQSTEATGVVFNLFLLRRDMMLELGCLLNLTESKTSLLPADEIGRDPATMFRNVELKCKCLKRNLRGIEL